MRRLLLFFFIATCAVGQTLPSNHICRLRCIAKCLNINKQPLPVCTHECSSYDNKRLCDTPDCWNICNDLGPASNLSTPREIKQDRDSGTDLLSWLPVSGATLYAIMYKLPTASSFDGDDYMITTSPEYKDFKNPKGTVCDGSDIAIMAVAANGLSQFSKSKSIEPLAPSVSPALTVKSLVYIDRPLIQRDYDANGTLELTFQYQAEAWPLGTEDLVVEPIFHNVICAKADFSRSIPTPDFNQGPNSTIVGLLGADSMYRQCQYMYYVQSVASKWCGTRTFIHSPPTDDINTIVIDCDSVTNAPCKKEVRHEPPVCGQVDDVEYKVMNNNVKASDKLLDLVLNVTFTPMMRNGETPTLYYVAFYGPAQNYSSDDERAFQGVNITQIMGNTTNCYNFTAEGTCAHPTNTSVLISDIHMDNLYGITFCAVKDPRNLTFPHIISDSRAFRPKANPIFVNSKVLHVYLTPFVKQRRDMWEDDYQEDELIHMNAVISLLSMVDYDEPFTAVDSSFKEQKQPEIATMNRLTNKVRRSPTIETNINETSGEEEGSSSAPISEEEGSGEGSGIQWNNTTALEEGSSEVSGSDPADGNSINETLKRNDPTTSKPKKDHNNPSTGPPSTDGPTPHYAGKNPVGLIIGVVIGSLFVILAASCGICILINKRQKAKNEKFRLKITQLELEKESRYTDFPKKFDIWEVERRNLVIHNDKKLGSGAFGAVYLGKLLGKSLGHKDANSPLGVNLMRAENCEVAVKMLPEYADELSKSEFFREIGLMKTLGYHERLVNMLACITDSEPLCLIVEYCSDGDLLHFLRTRCKYMLKLDELEVDYHSPPVDDNYDPNMIITLKQLLMFAVQISYGLEYLSQKGFVHRDVAARNILVHEMNCCKIGDFGLCRYIYSDNSHYKSKGGRLPLKWMSPEAIRHYEFSTQSDVWSFGILLFEIITLGGSPYPGVQPEDMLTFLENGGRMEQPDNCPDDFYSVMKECWSGDPEIRPEFSQIRQKLAGQLEDVTEEYSYLKLDAQKDYYNVQYGDQKPDVIIVPEDGPIKPKLETILNGSLSSVESIPRDSVIFDPNDDIDRMKAANKKQKDEDTQSSLVTDSLSISVGAISDSNV